MKIKKGFVIRKVGGECVVVPVGEMSKDFHGMIRLNETGAFLWNLMAEKNCSEDDLVDAILAEYALPYRFESAVANAADRISEEITAEDIAINGNNIKANGEINVFTASGSLVASGNGNVTVSQKGLYIVEANGAVHKVLIK